MTNKQPYRLSPPSQAFMDVLQEKMQKELDDLIEVGPAETLLDEVFDTEPRAYSGYVDPVLEHIRDFLEHSVDWDKIREEQIRRREKNGRYISIDDEYLREEGSSQ